MSSQVGTGQVKNGQVKVGQVRSGQVGPKIFQTPYFLTQNFLRPKFFYLEYFSTQKFFDLKFCWTENLFGLKIFWDPKVLDIELNEMQQQSKCTWEWSLTLALAQLVEIFLLFWYSCALCWICVPLILHNKEHHSVLGIITSTAATQQDHYYVELSLSQSHNKKYDDLYFSLPIIRNILSFIYPHPIIRKILIYILGIFLALLKQI